MDQNIAPTYGSIHSSSSEAGGNPASNIIDSYKTEFTQYMSLSNADEWIIIDLGAEYSITGFKLWSGADTTVTRSIKNYRVGISSTPDSFNVVASGQVSLPIVIGDTVRLFSHTTAILDSARYIKLYLDDNWGSSAAITSCEFEIYSPAIMQGQADIFSNAEIYHESNQENILSNAYIKPAPTHTVIATITADAVITQGDNINSDSWISDIGSQITSNSIVLGPETITIISDAMIYRSGSAATLSIFMTGRSTGRISDTIIEASGSRDLLIYVTDISTSDEVIVADMITSNPMDMLTIVPPLGYQNYDWKYDWVVRTYDSAQYRFEIRAEDTLSELHTAVFSEIKQGQIISRGQVPRYHQWRCHVWASGSGDFELHQFTIKGYVDQPANSLYRSLQDQTFTTVSTVKKRTQRSYEPLNPKLWGGTYIPGDCDADGIVDAYDQVYLTSYLLYEGLTPSPLLAGDVNYNGEVNAVDLTYLIQYLHNDGPPPIWSGPIE